MMIVQPGRFGAACAIDPYAANRVFFLRGQGANGAKPTADETGKPLTWNGNAQISTSNSKWPAYGSSVSVQGNGGFGVTTPWHTDFDVGTGMFTARGYVYVTAGQGAVVFGSQRDNKYMLLYVEPGSSNLRFLMSTDGASWAVSITGPALSTGWHDAEVGRAADGTIRLFADGAVVATTSNTGAPAAVDFVGVGGYASQTWYGNYSDAQFHKGACLHTAAYTPATLPPC